MHRSMLSRYFLLGLLILPVSGHCETLIGRAGDDRLIGTPALDSFFGGDGADTFVIESVASDPDVVLDFDPDEGDQLELSFPWLDDLRAATGNFSLDRKGVLTMDLDGRRVPIVDLQMSNLKFEVDHRKGRYLLKFERKLGN